MTKKVRYQDICSVNIHNLPDCFRAVASLPSSDIFIKCSDNRKNMADLFGKPHQYYTSEYRYHVYRFEKFGGVFWVFTSLKGTSIELEVPKELEYDEVIAQNEVDAFAFVTWFIDQLRPYYPVGVV